jgi:hypothetical protein
LQKCFNVYIDTNQYFFPCIHTILYYHRHWEHQNLCMCVFWEVALIHLVLAHFSWVSPPGSAKVQQTSKKFPVDHSLRTSMDEIGGGHGVAAMTCVPLPFLRTCIFAWCPPARTIDALQWIKDGYKRNNRNNMFDRE